MAIRVEIPDDAFVDTPVDTPEVSATSTESVIESSDSTDRAIPYDRFKAVIDERNSFRHELQNLRSEFEKLKTPTVTQSATPAPAIEVDNTPAGRLARLEFAEAERQLERDVSAAMKEFPTVPEAVLYRAIAMDGTANPLDVARNYHNFVEEIRKDALAGVVITPPKTPPPQVRTVAPATAPQPTSLREAHALARKAFAGIQW